MAVAPYKKVYYNGKLMNARTRAMVQEAEKRLGYELTIIQGSYNAGVDASGGTHDGGGALDLAPWDWPTKVMVLRRIGFAAWYRPAIAGLWSAHIHAIAIGDREMSASAARQVVAYYAGRDGLASNGPDPHGRPDPQPVFEYWRLHNIDFSNVWYQMWKAKPKKVTPGVRRVQRALRAKVNHTVAVDGLAGTQTQRAWRKFRLRYPYLTRIEVMKRLGRGHFTVRK